MIDEAQVIMAGLDRMVPVPSGGRADWEEVLRRAGVPEQQQRRRLTLGRALVLALLAITIVVVVTPVGATIGRGLGDFTDWLTGKPGAPAPAAEQQRFEGANGHSWASFPKGTRLRELIDTTVDGKRYRLFGFRSGDTVCLRLRAVSLGHTTEPACAPVSTLAHVSAPVLVVSGNSGFADEHAFPAASFSFGIVTDSVRRVDVNAIDGTHRAVVGGNAYLWVQNEPTTGQKVTSLLVTTVHVHPTTIGVRSPSFFDLSPFDGRLSGPSRVTAPIRHPTVGWYVRRQRRGLGVDQAHLTVAQRRFIHATGFTRLVKPDPLSDVVVGLTRDGSCFVVVGSVKACWRPHTFFSQRGPLNVVFFSGGPNGSDQFTGVAGVAADGIARVRIFLGDGESQTAALRDNMFTALVPNTGSIRIVAYDAANHVAGIDTLPLGSGLRLPKKMGILRPVSRIRGPNGTTATISLGPNVRGFRCWRVDFSSGQSRRACRPLTATGGWIEVEVAQPAARDVFLVGHCGEKVARVRLVLPGGDTVTGRPTEGLFVLAVPRTHLRPERQHAFVVGLDRHGRRTQRFGVLFRANA